MLFVLFQLGRDRYALEASREQRSTLIESTASSGTSSTASSTTSATAAIAALGPCSSSTTTSRST
jgi:hypothetical protein